MQITNVRLKIFHDSTLTVNVWKMMNFQQKQLNQIQIWSVPMYQNVPLLPASTISTIYKQLQYPYGFTNHKRLIIWPILCIICNGPYAIIHCRSPHGPYSMETYDMFISFQIIVVHTCTIWSIRYTVYRIQHLIRNNKGQSAQKVPKNFIDIIIFHI